MNTTQSKLQAIINSKDDIRRAINEKGVEVIAEVPLRLYAEKISEIENNPPPIINPIEITENGEYFTPYGVDGFNPVTVDVPIPEPEIRHVPLQYDINARGCIIINNSMYISGRNSNLVIFDLLTKQSRYVQLSGNSTINSIQLWGNNLYFITRNYFEIFDLITETSRLATVSFNINASRESSAIWGNKLYTIGYTTIDIFDLITETLFSVELGIGRIGTSNMYIWGNNLYITVNNKMLIFDLVTEVLSRTVIFTEISMFRRSYGERLYNNNFYVTCYSPDYEDFYLCAINLISEELTIIKRLNYDYDDSIEIITVFKDSLIMPMSYFNKLMIFDLIKQELRILELYDDYFDTNYTRRGNAICNSDLYILRPYAYNNTNGNKIEIIELQAPIFL